MVEDKLNALVCATDTMVRQTLSSTVTAENYVLAGEVDSAQNLLQLVALTEPHLIVVDNDLPNRQAIEWLPEIVTAAPEAAVLLIANDQGIREAAMAGGAFGIVYKTNLHELSGALGRARQWLEDPDLHASGERRTGKDRRWHDDWNQVTNQRRSGGDRRQLE
jgi:DNA-binding NarL/FixJ family response regulator